jgi:hypothetical protein
MCEKVADLVSTCLSAFSIITYKIFNSLKEISHDRTYFLLFTIGLQVSAKYSHHQAPQEKHDYMRRYSAWTGKAL